MNYLGKITANLIIGCLIGFALNAILIGMYGDLYWPTEIEGLAWVAILAPALIGTVKGLISGVGHGILSSLGVAVLGFILAFIVGFFYVAGWAGVLALLLFLGLLHEPIEEFIVYIFQG